MFCVKPIFWKLKMLVCTLGGEGGGGLKKCTVCTLMKMLTFLDGPLNNLGQYDRSRVLGYEPVDGVLVVLSSDQNTYCHFCSLDGRHTYPIWWTNVAIFN